MNLKIFFFQLWLWKLQDFEEAFHGGIKQRIINNTIVSGVFAVLVNTVSDQHSNLQSETFTGNLGNHQ